MSNLAKRIQRIVKSKSIDNQMRDQVLAQHDRWRLWAPVAYGGGAALYFALLEEPPFWPLALMAAVATALWFGARRLGFGRGVTVPLMLSDGASYALPPEVEALERRHRKAQRVVARR